MTDGAAPAAGRRQRLVLALLWIAFFTAYLDRTSISVAGPALRRTLQITPEAFGYVLSAFTAGYALMQIPGGLLADRFGVKRMLVLALGLWSIFTGLTGLAASLAALVAVRFFFGIGEGLENGAHFKGLADTFSSRERPLASAVLHTGIALGPALVSPVASAVIAAAGWPSLFLWSTLPGIVVALLVASFYPADAPHVRRPPSSSADGFARRGAWSPFAAYLLFNIAFWGFLGWMPSYLSEARHIALQSLGWLASVPYLFGFLGLLSIGYLSRGPLVERRRFVVAGSYLAAGAGLFIAFSQGSTAGSIAGLSAAAFFLYGTFGPFWAVVLERAPEASRGAFATFVNFGGQLGGFIAPIVVGKIVQATGSYTGGFAFMSAAVVLAAGVMALSRAEA